MPVHPLPVAVDSPELNLAEVTMPSFDGKDDKKRRYLSFRLCAFSQREAAARSAISVKQVKAWVAQDPNFAKLETTDLLTLRRLFAKDFVAMQFTRNMKLALDRDETVLDKATTTPDQLTAEEQAYLLRIRPLYTPDGLRAVEELSLANKGGQEEFSFDQIVIISRRISQKAFPQQPPDVSSIVDAVGKVMDA